MNRAVVEFMGSNGYIMEETDNEYKIHLFSGADMWCPKSDESVTPCLIRDFFWESWISGWFINEAHTSENFIDVGANSGYYSALAVYEGLNTYAFEPNLDYIPLLQKNPRVKVFPYGVSDKIGTTTLYIPGNLEGSATLRADFDLSAYDVRTVEIETTTLDEAFKDIPLYGKTIVKVDAEGMEEHVMRGAQNMDAVWMLEYTPGSYDKNFLTDLQARFELSLITHDGGEAPVSPEHIIAHGDWLMLVLRPKI